MDETPPIPVGDLAQKIGAEIIGDPSIKVSKIASLEHAGQGDLTFFSDPRKSSLLKTTKASAIIVPKDVPIEGKCLLVVENPYVAFARAQAIFRPGIRSTGEVSPQAFVHPDAEVGENVTIAPFAYVGREAKIGNDCILFPHVYIGRGTVLGKGCVLYPGVRVYHDCHLGDRVILHSGVVVGSDGFGYAWDGNEHVKIPQVGRAIIGSDVEIGANTTVDRGTIEDTVIGEGVKIDNLVQIGHNVKIGPKAIIVAQVGIAGSAEIGAGSILAGQVGVAGHIRIGNQVKVAAQSGIHKNVKDGDVISGSPAMPFKEWMKMVSAMPRLPEIRRKVRDMEKKLGELEERLFKLSPHEEHP